MSVGVSQWKRKNRLRRKAEISFSIQKIKIQSVSRLKKVENRREMCLDEKKREELFPTLPVFPSSKMSQFHFLSTWTASISALNLIFMNIPARRRDVSDNTASKFYWHSKCQETVDNPSLMFSLERNFTRWIKDQCEREWKINQRMFSCENRCGSFLSKEREKTILIPLGGRKNSQKNIFHTKILELLRRDEWNSFSSDFFSSAKAIALSVQTGEKTGCGIRQNKKTNNESW